VLAETLAALSKPGTTMLLCNPGAPMADANPSEQRGRDHAAFFSRLCDFGCEWEDISTEANIPRGSCTDRGWIHLVKVTLPLSGQSE
jgi:hypothetical protein